MSMHIQYTHTARRDLRKIYAYIAHALLVPDTAMALTKEMIAAVHSLAYLPERNPLYKEEPWHSQGVRFLPVKRYLIFYTVQKDAGVVTVVRILFAERDIRRQLDETTEWESL